MPFEEFDEWEDAADIKYSQLWASCTEFALEIEDGGGGRLQRMPSLWGGGQPKPHI
jgi:hypothetical protein